MTLPGTSLRLKGGSLEIQARGLTLWANNANTPAGSCKLSRTQAMILWHAMLAPSIQPQELISILWPNPDLEPQEPQNVIRQQLHRLKIRLAPLGIRLRSHLGPGAGSRPLYLWVEPAKPIPAPIIDHQ